MKKSDIIILLSLVLIISAASLISFLEYRNSNPEGVLTVSFFDVGQGDAALVNWSNGAVLVDAGTNESENKLISYIRKLGVKTIDCAVFSHPHEDHIGGADGIFEYFRVKSVLMPDLYTDNRSYENMLNGISEEGCEVFEALPGAEYTFDDVTVTVLSSGKEYADLNLDCTVIKLEYKDVSFLFMGDCEGVAETDLIQVVGEMLDSDVLKVGHHGSKSATTDEFLNIVTPDIAVISCGVDNDYGHPHDEVIDRLLSHGVTVKRTDEENTVTVRTDGITVWVEE